MNGQNSGAYLVSGKSCCVLCSVGVLFAMTALSRRSQNLLKLTAAPYYQGTDLCRSSPYCARTNTSGYMNLRLAETRLMEKEISAKLAECHATLGEENSGGTSNRLGYASLSDTHSRSALATYFRHAMRVPNLEASHLVTSCAATATVEQVFSNILDIFRATSR